MGVKVKIGRSGWKHHRPGAIVELDRGVADIVVNRRKLGSFVEDVQTLVPANPGLSQLVDTVSSAASKKSRKGA